MGFVNQAVPGKCEGGFVPIRSGVWPQIRKVVQVRRPRGGSSADGPPTPQPFAFLLREVGNVELVGLVATCLVVTCCLVAGLSRGLAGDHLLPRVVALLGRLLFVSAWGRHALGVVVERRPEALIHHRSPHDHCRAPALLCLYLSAAWLGCDGRVRSTRRVNFFT